MDSVVFDEAIFEPAIPKIKEQELGVDDLPFLWDVYAKARFGKIHKLPCFKKMDEVLKSFFVQRPSSCILDAGCGEGTFFKAILTGIHPSLLIAADWSGQMLISAKKQARKLQQNGLGYFEIRLEQRDLSDKFPWPDDYFDATISHMFSCFVPKPWQFVMAELHRVTKDGGYIYLTTFLAGWDFSRVVKKHIFGEMRSPIGLYHGLRLKKYPAHITEIAKRAGLTHPYKDELIAFYKKLGVREILREEIFWGAGIALRVQVHKPFNNTS